MWYHGLKLVPNSGVLHVNGKCLPLGSERQVSGNTGFGFGICLFHQPLQMRHVSMSAMSKSILIKA